MIVLNVLSQLPAKEISIKELEQIFIKHLNGTYKWEYKVLLEIPDNAGKNILSSSAELIGEGKAVACILKDGNVIAVVGQIDSYRVRQELKKHIFQFPYIYYTTLQLLKKSNAQGTFRSIISLQTNPYERE